MKYLKILVCNIVPVKVSSQLYKDILLKITDVLSNINYIIWLG